MPSSYTWEPDTEEVTFKDQINGTVKNKAGYIDDSKISRSGSDNTSPVSPTELIDNIVSPDSSTPALLYSYTPLRDVKNIRLLQLQPQKNNGELHARLEEVSLEAAENLGYNCLSYAWGPAVFSKRIFIDSAVLSITANLFAALQVLADKQKGTLWIDAICINQLDFVEKARQIPLMTDIYRSANNVLVWLGEETATTRAAFEWIPKITKEMEVIVDKEISSRQKSLRCRELLATRNESTAATELFERSWLERLWVLQEVVAARSVQVMCGPFEMPYETLTDFAFLLNSGRITHQCLLSPGAELGHKHLMEMHTIKDDDYRSLYMSDSDNLDIIDLIIHSRSRKCYDPRDRLFAVAGLATRPSSLPYSANYEKGVAEVYRDFAIHNIRQTNLLRILAYCVLGSKRMNDLPSWVPDWTNVGSLTFSEPPVPHSPRMYHASGRQSGKYQSPIYQPNSKPPALILRGFTFDTIKIVWPLPHVIQGLDASESSNEAPGSNPVNHIGQTLEQLLLFCGPFSEHHLSWPIFWRLLICDRSVSTKYQSRAIDADERGVEVTVSAIIHDWQSNEYERRKTLPSSSEPDSNKEPQFGAALSDFCLRWELEDLPKNPIAQFFSLPKIKGQMAWQNLKGVAQRLWGPPKSDPGASPDNLYATMFDFSRALSAVFSGRSFCVTTDGRYGWVPDVAVAGDSIAIFAGHDAPMVIRLCDKDSYMVVENMPYGGGSYLVVGESYLQGVMDGEAVTGKLWEETDQIRLI